MHTSVRAVLTALALVVPGVALSAGPANAAAVFVELNPSTVPAGDEVGVRASCDDNLVAATVTSELFDDLTVQPRYGFLTATTRVPAGTKAGDYEVALRCPDGQTAAATLHVVRKVTPARGPATGGGGAAPGQSAPLMIGGGAAVFAGGLALAVMSARRRRAS